MSNKTYLNFWSALRINRLIYVLLTLFFLQGCVGVQSFPTVARAGDTITLMIGSSDNVNVSGTTVTYTPVSPPGPPVDMTANIRSIFKLYPDNRSAAQLDSDLYLISLFSGHGASMDVMVLDLPATILPGTGTINVQSAASYPLFLDGLSPIGRDINIEIIPGTGVQNTFDLFQNGAPSPLPLDLTMLEVMPHYQIRPQFITTPSPSTMVVTAVNNQFAGAEITINGVLNSATSLATETELLQSFRILRDEETILVRQSQVQFNWKRNGGDIVINFISPDEKMIYFEASVVVLFIDPTHGFVTKPTASIRYFDLNGNEVSGPTVSVFECTNALGCI